MNRDVTNETSARVAELVRQRQAELSPAERKLARVLLATYPIAGLESVARFAERASVSAPTVTRFITKLGFKGVVMTDSIEAAAVRTTGSTEQVAVRSIRAGDDIVLTTSHRSWVRAYRALLAEARASRSFRARVRHPQSPYGWPAVSTNR